MPTGSRENPRYPPLKIVLTAQKCLRNAAKLLFRAGIMVQHCVAI